MSGSNAAGDAEAASAQAAAPAAETDDTAPAATDAHLAAMLAGDWRDPANVARDRYRHPAETLGFFGLAPGQTVVEITPGGGWYAEILAPYLRDGGQYVAAVVDPAALPAGGGRDYQQRSRDRLEAKFAGDAERYDRATVVAFDPAAPVFGPAGSADLVLTFRNVHNWRGDGNAQAMFNGFFDVLKPGGTLGVVEHRAAADVADDDKSGYVGTDQVIALAEAAGFELAGRSEVNANPADTKDHPNGVWTLPPGNNHDEADATKYRAIGESDRMTLRFRKPAAG
ncbi:methyltransferase [Lysobacter arseniciresistens ZS79]|uniref:Methyltransferase n=1 Tax=Lysobacter arseniciresistens ZS79 TaxID=913325 RepID=A0A0A0F2Z1_9GAMM|nr:methyltransferase [Lysobacter arseniciresistens ZS79]